MRRAAFCWIALAILVLDASSSAAQQCREARYRWSQKIDTTLRGVPAHDVEISTILSRWELPPIGAGKWFRCAPRGGRERMVYGVVGWLRRLERKKDDGDWHLELTENRGDKVRNCIVVEIPLAELHGDFRQARANLVELLRGTRIDREGDLEKPVRIRVVGAAFFDGQHLSGSRRPVALEHGRCNSSARALWEIHPVYRVERP